LVTIGTQTNSRGGQEVVDRGRRSPGIHIEELELPVMLLLRAVTLNRPPSSLSKICSSIFAV